MLFNSVEFTFFLPVVFILYWFAVYRSIRLQNLLLLVASYFFYAWWDWRFLSLIFISSLLDFLVGLWLDKAEDKWKRKLLLCASIGVNIGFLGFFKYYNFFLENFVSAFTLFGSPIKASTLHIVLPVGISFYTFQTLSYTIDIYRKKAKPTNNLVAFFSYVSFFPQLVAGPIERSTNLLPQFLRKRSFEQGRAVDGLRQMLWGLFKKIVIADNCAIFADEIFANSDSLSGSTLWLGVFFFAMQIYGDFSGYSDIAIGTARLFGFDLKRNFAFPYFSRDIAEFWRRWHISLSTWFRDYVYIPLGGSRGSRWNNVRNVFIIFLVSGFWHGANWTFLMWGFVNALLFLPLILSQSNRKNLDTVAQSRLLPSIKEVLQIGLTFTLTTLAWIFFRAESLDHAFNYLGGILDPSLFSLPEIFPEKTLLFVTLFLLVEWIQREKEHALQLENLKIARVSRWSIYYVILFSIYFFGGAQQQFIYFQF